MTNSDELAAAAGIVLEMLAPGQWAEYTALRLHALQSDPQAFGSSYAREADLKDD